MCARFLLCWFFLSCKKILAFMYLNSVSGGIKIKVVLQTCITDAI